MPHVRLDEELESNLSMILRVFFPHPTNHFMEPLAFKTIMNTRGLTPLELLEAVYRRDEEELRKEFKKYYLGYYISIPELRRNIKEYVFSQGAMIELTSLERSTVLIWIVCLFMREHFII